MQRSSTGRTPADLHRQDSRLSHCPIQTSIATEGESVTALRVPCSLPGTPFSSRTRNSPIGASPAPHGGERVRNARVQSNPLHSMLHATRRLQQPTTMGCWYQRPVHATGPALGGRPSHGPCSSRVVAFPFAQGSDIATVSYADRCDGDILNPDFAQATLWFHLCQLRDAPTGGTSLRRLNQCPTSQPQTSWS